MAGVVPSASAATGLPAGTVVTITGHGWGHGHGMSQYGARGAAEQGLSWQRIVGFYYPGTSLSTAKGRIRVLISRNSASRVRVAARPGLVVSGGGRTWQLAKRHPKASRFQIVRASHGRNALQLQKGGWHTIAVTRATLQFHAKGGTLRLLLPHGGSETYRGSLRAATPPWAPRTRVTVNVVGLEDYLRGVVSSEMPSSWSAQAIDAQAVAARTYAAYERYIGGTTYDICDSTACQVYGGVGAESRSSDRALAATRGRILTYRGKPAFTQFTSSNGGFSLAGGEPYLVSQADPYEKSSGNPYETWTVKRTIKDVKQHWSGAGQITGITVDPVAGTGGRYADTVTIHGTKRDYTVSAADFEAWAGLRSAYFSVSVPSVSSSASVSPSASTSGSSSAAGPSGPASPSATASK